MKLNYTVNFDKLGKKESDSIKNKAFDAVYSFKCPSF